VNAAQPEQPDERDRRDGRLREVIAAHVGVDPGGLAASTRLSADLGLDSLAVLDLGMTLEDAFDVALPDLALEKADTVADLMAAVRSRGPAWSTARSKSP
jgi:acyl carrier protein